MIIRRIIRTGGGGGGRSGNETAGGRKTVEKIKKKNNYCFLLLPGYLYLSLVLRAREKKENNYRRGSRSPAPPPTLHLPRSYYGVCVCIYVILNNNNIMYARARPISV